MSSMRRKLRRLAVQRRYAERTAWNPRHTPPAWSRRWIDPGHQRAWDAVEAERERRTDLAARRWWPE